ncbi:MAG: hypothetical protein MJK10_14325 [Pseudomonadales bacterium]|nr:hypothetical protein [Pseudomonadales bacterium]NRA17058.1 hypothetical protein [Oceanospirillaceae bacterium]
MSHSEELVQIRNTLNDIAEKEEQQRFTELSIRFGPVSKNIINDLLKTRMRPIGALLNRYKRIVRDLAQNLDKQIRLKIIVENIELDSNVIDVITDPFGEKFSRSWHRNPDVRLAAGKPAGGAMTLHAYNESGKVVI